MHYLQVGLQEKLSLLHNKLDWLERFDITSPVTHASVENGNGDPNVELDAIMEFAEFKREPIAQFQCNI